MLEIEDELEIEESDENHISLGNMSGVMDVINISFESLERRGLTWRRGEEMRMIDYVLI